MGDAHPECRENHDQPTNDEERTARRFYGVPTLPLLEGGAPPDRIQGSVVPNERRTHVDDPQAPHLLAGFLHREFSRLPGASRLEVLCIGTDRSTGDSLGPLVGTILGDWPAPGFCVRGTLENPVHATNLSQSLAALQNNYPPPLVIAVDACLGRLDNVGSITAGHGPLRPGAGVNKNLPEAGDLHIVGTVNVGGFMEYFVLQNTRLNLVLRMARIIAFALQDAWTRSQQSRSASYS